MSKKWGSVWQGKLENEHELVLITEAARAGEFELLCYPATNADIDWESIVFNSGVLIWNEDDYGYYYNDGFSWLPMSDGFSLRCVSKDQEIYKSHARLVHKQSEEVWHILSYDNKSASSLSVQMRRHIRIRDDLRLQKYTSVKLYEEWTVAYVPASREVDYQDPLKKPKFTDLWILETEALVRKTTDLWDETMAEERKTKRKKSGSKKRGRSGQDVQNYKGKAKDESDQQPPQKKRRSQIQEFQEFIIGTLAKTPSKNPLPIVPTSSTVTLPPSTCVPLNAQPLYASTSKPSTVEPFHNIFKVADPQNMSFGFASMSGPSKVESTPPTLVFPKITNPSDMSLNVEPVPASTFQPTKMGSIPPEPEPEHGKPLAFSTTINPQDLVLAPSTINPSTMFPFGTTSSFDGTNPTLLAPPVTNPIASSEVSLGRRASIVSISQFVPPRIATPPPQGADPLSPTQLDALLLRSFMPAKPTFKTTSTSVPPIESEVKNETLIKEPKLPAPATSVSKSPVSPEETCSSSSPNPIVFSEQFSLAFPTIKSGSAPTKPTVQTIAISPRSKPQASTSRSVHILSNVSNVPTSGSEMPPPNTLRKARENPQIRRKNMTSRASAATKVSTNVQPTLSTTSVSGLVPEKSHPIDKKEEVATDLPNLNELYSETSTTGQNIIAPKSNTSIPRTTSAPQVRTTMSRSRSMSRSHPPSTSQNVAAAAKILQDNIRDLVDRDGFKVLNFDMESGQLVVRYNLEEKVQKIKADLEDCGDQRVDDGDGGVSSVRKREQSTFTSVRQQIETDSQTEIGLKKSVEEGTKAHGRSNRQSETHLPPILSGYGMDGQISTSRGESVSGTRPTERVPRSRPHTTTDPTEVTMTSRYQSRDNTRRFDSMPPLRHQASDPSAALSLGTAIPERDASPTVTAFRRRNRSNSNVNFRRSQGSSDPHIHPLTNRRRSPNGIELSEFSNPDVQLQTSFTSQP